MAAASCSRAERIGLGLADLACRCRCRLPLLLAAAGCRCSLPLVGRSLLDASAIPSLSPPVPPVSHPARPPASRAHACVPQTTSAARQQASRLTAWRLMTWQRLAESVVANDLLSAPKRSGMTPSVAVMLLLMQQPWSAAAADDGKRILATSDCSGGNANSCQYFNDGICDGPQPPRVLPRYLQPKPLLTVRATPLLRWRARLRVPVVRSQY